AGNGEWGMVRYQTRQELRSTPSNDQHNFLELLRERGPQDNAQTAVIRRSTKRACQVRGWVEWRCVDGFPGTRAWHMTVVGRKALEASLRFFRARSPTAVQKTRADFLAHDG